MRHILLLFFFLSVSWADNSILQYQEASDNNIRVRLATHKYAIVGKTAPMTVYVSPTGMQRFTKVKIEIYDYDVDITGSDVVNGPYEFTDEDIDMIDFAAGNFQKDFVYKDGLDAIGDDRFDNEYFVKVTYKLDGDFFDKNIKTNYKVTKLIEASDSTFDIHITNNGDGNIYKGSTKVINRVTPSPTAFDDVLLKPIASDMFKFEKWYINLTASNKIVTSNEYDKYCISINNTGQLLFDQITNDFTITPVWKRTHGRIILTNDGNGSTNFNNEKINIGVAQNIIATPNEGYEFDRWVVISGSPNLDKNSSTTSIIVNSDYEIKATFKLRTYNINFYTSPLEGGNLNQPSNKNVSHGDKLSITAAPNPGYEFTSWSINGSGISKSGNSSSTDFTFKSGGAVTANFQKLKYGVFVQSSDENKGTVSASGSSPYAYQSKIDIEAKAERGFKFSNWNAESGIVLSDKNSSKTVATVGVIPNSSAYITASFNALPELSLNLDNKNPELGSINKSPVYTVYYSGEIVTLTATPKSSASFKNWTIKSGAKFVDGTSSTSPTAKIEIQNNCVVEASFNDDTPLDNIILDNKTKDLGTVTSDPIDLKNIKRGTSVTITATEISQNFGKFIKWVSKQGTVTGDLTKKNLTFNVNGSDEIEAVFEQELPEYTVSIVVNDALLGSVNVTDTVIEHGKNLIVSATELNYGKFDSWTISAGTVNSDPSIKTGQFTITGNCKITANFIDTTPIYTVTASSSDPLLGTVDLPNASVKKGQQTTLTAIATKGTFVKWEVTGDAILADPSSVTTTLTVNSDCAVTALFEDAFVGYTLSLESSDIVMGTVDLVGSNTGLNPGDKLSIIATPSFGYEFVQWSVISGLVKSLENNKSASTIVTMDNSNCTLKAVFKKENDIAILDGGEFTGTYVEGVHIAPNPVALSDEFANIIVAVREPSEVTIVIYDVSGNLIDKQSKFIHVDESHSFQWDMSNLYGKRVASGTYKVVAIVESKQGNKLYKTKIGIKK